MLRDDPTTYGHVMPFCDYILTDDEDHDVPPGAIGELCVRSSTVMLGYWNHPAATAETLKNAWHHTGDLFVRLANGQDPARVLETLAAQKLVPILTPADQVRKVFHARWLPILDSPKDGPRLAQLEAAMPPVCHAALSPQSKAAKAEEGERSSSSIGTSPRSLVSAFLDAACDGLARRWGRAACPRVEEIDGQVVLSGKG